MLASPRTPDVAATPADPVSTGAVLSLADLAIGAGAYVVGVKSTEATAEARELALRLLEIGFIEGEHVRVIARGHPGREPIAVRVGGTTFALRRFEAAQVQVALPAATGAAR
jgi:ferrous iron transport protein A